MRFICDKQEVLTMAKKHSAKKLCGSGPINSVSITRFPHTIRIQTERRRIRKEDLFDQDGNISCTGNIFIQELPEILVKYTLYCPAANIQKVIADQILSKNRDKTYNLCFDFSLRLDRALFELLLKPVTRIDRQRHCNLRQHGYNMDSKIISTTHFIGWILASYKPKTRKHRKPMSGSPKGWDRVEPWMSVSSPGTQPLEGGRCSPK